VGVLAREVHLGIDQGPHGTRPICGCQRPTRTTATEAANCSPCITRALELGLNVEGLVQISERIRRLTNKVRLHCPEAAKLTNVQMAGLFQHCHTTAAAVTAVREHLKGS
jgi:hypothetical protein